MKQNEISSTRGNLGTFGKTLSGSAGIWLYQGGREKSWWPRTAASVPGYPGGENLGAAALTPCSVGVTEGRQEALYLL